MARTKQRNLSHTRAAQMTVFEIKTHLKTLCQFTEEDTVDFFRLFNLSPFVCCRIYGLDRKRSVVLDLDITARTALFLDAVVAACPVGPRREEMKLALSNHLIQ